MIAYMTQRDVADHLLRAGLAGDLGKAKGLVRTWNLRGKLPPADAAAGLTDGAPLWRLETIVAWAREQKREAATPA